MFIYLPGHIYLPQLYNKICKTFTTLHTTTDVRWNENHSQLSLSHEQCRKYNGALVINVCDYC